MRVSSIPLAAIVLGLPVLAFLLPPDLHLTNTELAVLEVVDSGSISVSVGCAGCNWHKDAEDEAGAPYQPGLESDLLFDIHTLHDRRILKINNADILPFGPTVALAALQVPSAAASTDYFTLSHSFHNLKLGYNILITSVLIPHSATKEITISLRITSVEGVRNDAIKELQIIVHQDTLTQQLDILSVTKKPLEGSVTELTNAGSDTCQGRFEYIIAMLHRKMDKFRGAGVVGCLGGEDHHTGYYRGRHGDHGGDHIDGNHHGENHMKDNQHMKDNRYMGETQGHRSHHKGDNMGGSQHIKGDFMGQGHCRYHGGSHRSQWLKHPNHHRGNSFTRLVSQTLMPILAGILAGVGAALVGLIVGNGMRKLYQVVARRGCGGVKSEEYEDKSDEEKGLLKEMKAREVAVEGLPGYLEDRTKTAEKE